jgi:Protein of unknown function (DUF2796)
MTIRSDFKPFASLLLILLALVPLAWEPASGDGFEQHHAHEHGKVTLNIAVDSPTLSMELDAPAANVVGFEHAPRTSPERAAVANAPAFIRAGRSLIGVPPAAGCHFVNTEFTEPKWEPDNEPAAAESKTGAAHEAHADYEARFSFRCDHPELLAWLEPWLLLKLMNVTEARINILTPSGQRTETVTNPRAHIRLQ